MLFSELGLPQEIVRAVEEKSAGQYHLERIFVSPARQPVGRAEVGQSARGGNARSAEEHGVLRPVEHGFKFLYLFAVVHTRIITPPAKNVNVLAESWRTANDRLMMKQALSVPQKLTLRTPQGGPGGRRSLRTAG